MSKHAEAMKKGFDALAKGGLSLASIKGWEDTLKKFGQYEALLEEGTSVHEQAKKDYATPGQANSPAIQSLKQLQPQGLKSQAELKAPITTLSANFTKLLEVIKKDKDKKKLDALKALYAQATPTMNLMTMMVTAPCAYWTPIDAPPQKPAPGGPPQAKAPSTDHQYEKAPSTQDHNYQRLPKKSDNAENEYEKAPSSNEPAKKADSPYGRFSNEPKKAAPTGNQPAKADSPYGKFSNEPKKPAPTGKQPDKAESPYGKFSNEPKKPAPTGNQSAKQPESPYGRFSNEPKKPAPATSQPAKKPESPYAKAPVNKPGAKA
jgi:hypothetical protein